MLRFWTHFSGFA